MSVAQLDVAVRLGAVTVILLLAWLLFRRRREVGAPAFLFAPMAVCLSGFLLGNTPDAALRPSGALGEIAHFASGCTVVFLWWFCLACFDRRFRLRGGVLATGVVWLCLAGADRGVLGSAIADKGLSWALVAIGFGIVGHLVWRLVGDRDGDLLQKRHDARVMVAVLLGGQLFIDLSADLLFGFAWRPIAFAMAQNAAILCFGLWLSTKLFAVRDAVLTFDRYRRSALPTPADAGPSLAVNPLLRRLRVLIEVERVHLDPDLTLATFVQKVKAPERDVRRLINHDLGYDHFRSFLNHHRLAEARRLLADPRRAGDKLIAIALDSGFASLASFNRVFRSAEACTPSRYREAALAGKPHAGRVLRNDRSCFEVRPAA